MLLLPARLPLVRTVAAAAAAIDRIKPAITLFNREVWFTWHLVGRNRIPFWALARPYA
jgi:hypothetical protein